MKVLCLGLSSIVSRRVLPAIESLEQVAGIEVASRRGAPPKDGLPAKVDRAYGGFDEALETSEAGAVYVSTVNSEHAPWARRALAAGFHVVVDKPAFLALEEAEELAGQARERGRVLAESTVYAAHPQVEICRRVFAEDGGAPRRITAHFSMPPLGDGNFRYRRALGGGALWDLGPYAVTLGRVFFGAEPESFSCVVNSRGGPDAVETAFSMLARYPGGRAVVGHFGFDTEYRNEITLLGGGAAVRVERFFTTPPDLENALEIHAHNEPLTRRAPAADSFACFLAGFLEACERPDGPEARRLAGDLLADARALAALRAAAGE